MKVFASFFKKKRLLACSDNASIGAKVAQFQGELHPTGFTC
jgi:hypothetical protein